jgi:predicted ATPase
VLPFASLVQGFEIIHASAVAIDGVAVLLVGGSGVGKSTLALNMHLSGAATFLTDDVVALEARNGSVLAHPGLPWAKIRGAVADLVGRPVAEEAEFAVDGDLFVPIARDDSPLRAGALVFLETGEADTLDVRRLDSPDPGALLATTFNFVIQTPSRLANQLEVFAAVARECSVFQALVPRRPGMSVATELLRVVTSLG